MKHKLLFVETQRFTQWWLWAILIGSLILTLVLYLWDFPKIPLFSLIISLVPFILAILFFLAVRLYTTINEDGIYVRFYPIHLKYKYYPWTDVKQLHVKRYHGAEYGGWGIKIASSRNKSYTISGNYGLQIEFKNGKKLLIGSQHPDELSKLLDTIRDRGCITK